MLKNPEVTQQQKPKSVQSQESPQTYWTLLVKSEESIPKHDKDHPKIIPQTQKTQKPSPKIARDVPLPGPRRKAIQLFPTWRRWRSEDLEGWAVLSGVERFFSFLTLFFFSKLQSLQLFECCFLAFSVKQFSC